MRDEEHEMGHEPEEPSASPECVCWNRPIGIGHSHSGPCHHDAPKPTQQPSAEPEPATGEQCYSDCPKWEGGHRPGCPNDDFIFSAGKGPISHAEAKEHAEYMIHTGSIEGLSDGEAWHEKRRVNLSRAYLAQAAEIATLRATIAEAEREKNRYNAALREAVGENGRLRAILAARKKEKTDD